MRYKIVDIVILIIFIISIPAVFLIVRNDAISDETKSSEGAIVYLQKGDQFYDQGKFSDSAVQYWEALKHDPKLEDAHFKLAQIYYENLWSYDALEQINELEKLNSNYPNLYLLKGKVYLNRLDDSDKAFQAFQKSVVNSPTIEAYYYLGTIYQQRNKKEEAILEYGKSVALSSDDKESMAKSFLQLGRIYKADMDFDKSIEMLKSALSIKPKSEEIISELSGAYSQKADIYKSEKEFGEAAKIYEEIIRLDPENPENIEYYMELGSIYRSDGLYDKAIMMYKAITKLDPLNFDAFSALKELDMLKSGAISE